MCIMASPVRSVTDTNIFVGHNEPGTRQATVYAMSVQLRASMGKGNAMILPVPVGVGGGRIDLIDLSGTPDFFEPFIGMFRERRRGLTKGFEDNDDLAVVRVGSYDVSIVPTVNDVKRLNAAVFDVSADTEHTLRENYPVGFAFLVAQLRESGNFHPIAYTHPLVGGRLFVPTRHEHGQAGTGDLPKWDHQIFYQGSRDADVMPREQRNAAFRRTAVDASSTVRSVRGSLKTSAAALLDYLYDGAPVSRIKAQGSLPNFDLTIPVA